VDDWEHEALQILSVDIRYPIDAGRAAATDAVAWTVDYRTVADGVFKAFEGQRIQLIETCAEQVAAWVLDHTAVQWVEVRVTKSIEKTAAKTATIQIHRERTTQ
jgi:dihydroneopterin aldolase